MTVRYTILFPKGSIFNKDHYIKFHMPLIQEHFPDLLRWEVSTLPEDAPYMVVTRVEWTSAEAFDSMHHVEAGKKVFADIANFSSSPPIFMKETPLASAP
ncbi:hypothetical protein B0J12DRAFT_685867 [Macrophomina phaseolina]|uniref:Ethyl tert-butyl ether degradation EthD n=1 Tax=Macrophomina phaseolina TaxID=35725 RepID=A0ABQ8FTK7_9PEZI|nr:hypothetical protein B0J12DRAFT_685867 [Macrophomina phaseolina]